MPGTWAGLSPLDGTDWLSSLSTSSAVERELADVVDGFEMVFG